MPAVKACEMTVTPLLTTAGSGLMLLEIMDRLLAAMIDKQVLQSRLAQKSF